MSKHRTQPCPLSVPILSILSILFLVSSPASPDALDDEHFLSMEFETPHTDWGQPYAQGKIKALFFSDGRGTAPREMVELMQRFDIDADAVFRIRVIDSTDYQWLGGDAGHERILRLLEERYDVYIFQGVPLTLLSAEGQYKLLKVVAEGAGLVLMGVNEDRVLKPERKVETLPPFLAKGPVGEAYSVRQGRAIRLPARPQTDYNVGWEVEYDYWQERLGRAVLWAAGREPQMDLDVAVEPAQMGRDAPARLAAVARWGRATAPKLTIEATLRRWDGWSTDLYVPPPDTAAGAVGLEMPSGLRAGEYHIDLRAVSRRKVEAWATTSFTVTSARTVEEVALDREWAEPGETLSGHVRLGGPPRPGEVIRVRLMDRRGRVLAREDLSSGAEIVPFSFPVDSWMPMLLRVEAACLDGRHEVAAAHVFFRVTKRNRGQFNFLVWDYPKGTLAPYGEESLARLGTTLHLSGGSPPIQVAAYDVAWVPYTTRIMSPKFESGFMDPVCWNDEPAVQEYVDGIVQKYEPARQHGVFAYSLGDETVTRGSCLHPACLTAYRRYLEQEYGGIAKLNASWDTEFISFDDVTLSAPDDNDEHAALRAKNYPRWYDRQAFQCYNFVQLCKRFGEGYKKMDSLALTGFEGAGRFRDGDDIDLIVRTNGFWSPYPGSGDEVIRSIAPRDFPRANWMGYTKDADSLLSKYWRMITRGTDAVWWWRWDALGRFNGFLAPHLGPFPATKDLAKDTEVVRDGLGTLLTRSSMIDDGIAILYSMPSAYASKVEAGTSYGSYEGQHTGWHTAIRDLGMQFRYVTDRMLRLGEFDAERYKVLILPQTEAIGPEEARVIRDFAEDGGTVIADVRPGLFDGHCKPLERGSLDDMFGIERDGNVESAGGIAAIEIPVEAEEGEEAAAAAFSWDEAGVDPAVRLADGQAMGMCGETPLCIVRKVRSGRAVLLNFAMGSFPNISVDDTPEEAATFLRALFAMAGVEPTVELMSRKERVRNVEVVRWRNGRIQLMALFRESGELDRANVTIPVGKHVYNLRNHNALGLVDTFEPGIIPSRATFFALLPAAAPDAKLELPRTAAPGQVVSARLSVPGAAGLHALRVRVKTPDGTPADWLDKVVMVGERSVDVQLPLAFNDPEGEWKVRAIDLYTNEAALRTLTVAAR